MTGPRPAPVDPKEADADAAYLRGLGDRVRMLRARRGMTRKALAIESGVSERYLAQLETGRGNISILLLRQLRQALGASLETLVSEEPETSPALAQSVDVLRRLSPSELERAARMINGAFADARPNERTGRIALIGLRGAGKSTLGKRLAKKLKCPFIELNQAIEAEAGMPIAEVFNLYGQAGYRRMERRCLDAVIAAHPRAVIATSGGIVSDASTFAALKSHCFTIWLKAAPAEHMQRVVAQGDMRPMANNRESMADLRRILRAREALYASADAVLDTARQSPDESLDGIYSEALKAQKK